MIPQQYLMTQPMQARGTTLGAPPTAAQSVAPRPLVAPAVTQPAPSPMQYIQRPVGAPAQIGLPPQFSPPPPQGGPQISLPPQFSPPPAPLSPMGQFNPNLPQGGMNLQQQQNQILNNQQLAAQMQRQNAPQQPMGMRGPMMPPQFSPTPPQGGNQSLEQQALNGGGADNKQQVSNFMTALNKVGAGGNNSFSSAPSTGGPAPLQNMIDPNAAYANNGGTQANTTSANYLSNVQQANTNPSMFGGVLGGVANAGNNPAALMGGKPGGLSTGLGDGSKPWEQQSQVPAQSMGGMNAGAVGAVQQNPSPQSRAGALGGLAVSDENLKNVQGPAERSIEHFLGTIGAHNYTYKDPRDGVGMFTSPMAQELEKTELGKQAVINTPRGKMVDYARLGGVNLAAASVLHREQQRLAAQVAKLRAEMRGSRS